MKKFVYFFLFAFVWQSCNQVQSQSSSKNFFSLTLSVKGPENGKIILSVYDFINQKVTSIDTLKLEEGKVTQKYPVKESVFYLLSIYQQQNVPLAIEPGENVIVDVDLTVPANIPSVKGCKGTEAIFQIVKKERELTEKHVKPLEAKYQDAQAKGDTEGMNKVTEEYQTIIGTLQKELNDFSLTQLGSSIAWLYLAEQWNNDTDITFLNSASEKLKKGNPKASYTSYLINKIDSFRATAIGSVAPEISLQDKDGNLIKLSSLKGKYILIDFWASWCGPCRAENPNVVGVYQKYKDKGFEIYGVALDKDKTAWLKAIEKDNLSWINVSDLKYWQSEAAKSYGVKSIPMNFLLDKNGKIIAKNLRGATLEKKLEEVFNKK